VIPPQSRTPMSVVIDTSRSPHARLRSLPLAAVRLTDRFWQPRREVNQRVTLPSQYQKCEETGRIDNFRRAAGKVGGPFRGRYYNDSDVYKWVEACAFALAEGPDPELERLLDLVIREIADAQGPDGYLNTYFTHERAGERWTDLRVLHELYCAGHLIQAAVAHQRCTGRDDLLRVARRYADYILEVFGPGKREGTCGHQEIEMAMVELYRLTGDRHPVHIDPVVAQANGFARPILHGLCTLGIAARTVAAQAGVHPARLLELDARLAAPVLPGDAVEVLSGVRDGVVHFEARVGQTTVLKAGRARFGDPG